MYKKSLSLSFSVSTVANWWKGERDSDVFFTRYVPPRWKIFVAFARLHGKGVEGERSYGRKGTFSSPPPPSSPRRNPCSPSPLSSCSRCYHCRLFCGFRIICAFPRLYPPKYNKIPLARLSSSSTFVYSPLDTIPRYTVVATIRCLQRVVHSWCVLRVWDSLDSGEGEDVGE